MAVAERGDCRSGRRERGRMPGMTFRDLVRLAPPAEGAMAGTGD